jgi:hypothetical protein
MKVILPFVLISCVIIGCDKDDDPFILAGQECITGTWIGAGCPESFGYDTLYISQNQVLINSADCEDICAGTIPQIIRNFDINEISDMHLLLRPSGGIICGSPAPLFGEPVQIEYKCLEDTLLWDGITFQRMVESPPCFEGIWTSDRCQNVQYGRDTLKINPYKQLTIIHADCGNNCEIKGPRTIQTYNLTSYTNDQLVLQALSGSMCGEPLEISSNPFPVAYECQGDTLLWGGTPFILHSRYRQ